MTAPLTAPGPGKPPRVLSGDEWQQSQYAPQRVGEDDPTKPKGPGRVLTGDEWESSQRAPSITGVRFPAMPKIASDRLGPTTGTALPGQFDTRPTPEQQVGTGIRNVSGALDLAASALPTEQAAAAHAIAATGRQVVAPAVENPAMTAAMFNPIGAVVGAGMAVHTVAKYGWQVAHEAFMSPEDRAKAEADPNRVSGEAAAVQAIMLGLGGLIAVKGAPKVADVTEGVPLETGAKGVSFFESPKGAETLGAAAGAHGMPETASPFPPETALDVAWKQGHAAARPTEVAAPPTEPATVTPSATEPAAIPATGAPPTPEPAAAPEIAAASKGGPAYRGPTPLYARLSNDALASEYRALVDKRTTEEPNAMAPLWTPEREAAAVEEIENRRRPDGSLSVPDKRALDRLQSEEGELYYVGRHTPESAAAERRLAVVNRHIAAIEKEMEGRGLNPAEVLARPATGEGAGPVAVEGTGEVKTRGLALGVEQQAIAKELTDYLGDLPEYRQLNMADQAQKAVRLLETNPELARRVALGEAPAPEGLHPASVFVAAEKRALEQGDVATIRDLASSKATEQTTTAAQHIRILGERDPESPVAAIQRIEQSRSTEGAGKAIGDAVAELKDHIEKGGMIDEGAWTRFIDSLRC